MILVQSVYSLYFFCNNTTSLICIEILEQIQITRQQEEQDLVLL